MQYDIKYRPTSVHVKFHGKNEGYLSIDYFTLDY